MTQQIVTHPILTACLSITAIVVAFAAILEADLYLRGAR
jgi:hypothetical protein